jgi:hypothetical protein
MRDIGVRAYDQKKLERLVEEGHTALGQVTKTGAA